MLGGLVSLSLCSLYSDHQGKSVPQAGPDPSMLGHHACLYNTPGFSPWPEVQPSPAELSDSWVRNKDLLLKAVESGTIYFVTPLQMIRNTHNRGKQSYN